MILNTQDPLIGSVLNSLDNVLVQGARLPDQVFRRLTDFCWLEFEEVLTDAFWECVSHCARMSGDGALFAVCIEPSPTDNFGHSGVSHYAVDCDSNAYQSFLDAGLIQRSINIRHMGEILAISGDSEKWAFLADRSREIMVGGHEAGAEWPLVRELRYHTFDTMLKLVAAPYRGKAPVGLLERLEVNYRDRSWPITSFREG
jgi:hypothetical protein